MSFEPYRPPTDTSSGTAPDEVRRHPLVAALLSLVVPGSGQLYTGRPELGLALFAGYTVAMFFGRSSRLAERPWLWLTVMAAGLLLMLGSTVEAAVRAYRHRRIPRQPLLRWFVLLPVVAGLFVVSVVVVPEPPGPQPGLVPTDAMAPTLRAGDRVLIDYEHYRDHPPARGDLALFRSPAGGALQVKRVIGLGGDRVVMRRHRAVVNGDDGLDRWAFPTSEANPPLHPPGFSIEVLPQHLFVLGDHRDNSRDSRFYGFVAEELLLGRVESIAYSPTPGRIGRRLDD